MKHGSYDGRGWSRRDLLKRERAAYKARRETELAKKRFLSTMSHDMRTPLNIIIGMTKLASANLSDQARLQEYLETVECSGKLLSRLVNDILDMSRIEREGLILQNEAASLKKFMRELEYMAQPAAEKKQQKLTVDTSGILHEYLEFDSLRLNQILLNLISNAVKFTPQDGTVQVTVTELVAETEETVMSGRNCRDGHALFCFCVTDTGIGMKEEFLHSLFCAFERECDGRIDKADGCGIGMALVGKLVELMDGRIEVNSTPEVGTSVSIVLDFKLAYGSVMEMEAENLFAADLEPELVFSGKRFLLVEDNELSLEIAKEILVMDGASVDTACDGCEGLEQFKNSSAHYYHLILSDVHMPVMDGHEMTRAIRKLDRSDAAVPILAMTADAFAEDIHAALAAGMSGHVAKPVDFEVMRREILRALSGSSCYIC